MRPNVRFVCLLVFGLVLIFNVSAQALPITGTLNITGEVQIDATHFDWLPLGGGTGTFFPGSSSTGTFTGLGGTQGVAKDLDSALQPVGVPFLLQSYLTFIAEPNLSFDLDFIVPGASIGALTLTDIPNVGVSLTWGVQTTVIDSGESACYTGIYSSQINNLTSSQLLALLSGGGAITSTYSASFAPCPTVPLPGTAFLVITGLAGFCWRWTRRRHE
jgi:hypothetical protein